MIPIKTSAAWKGTSDCLNCGIRDAVLFSELTAEDFELIHAPIDDLNLAAGTLLFQEGESATGIFTVRLGMVKIIRTTTEGRQRIVRVLRPGDVAGMEALTQANYGNDAVTLTDLSVCRIPLAVVHELDSKSPRLHRALMTKWSRSLKEADDWLADLNFGSARSRVSNFFLKMRNSNESEIVTIFSREDMGAMMDLTMETVSREISALAHAKSIEALDKQNRVCRILNVLKLQNV